MKLQVDNIILLPDENQDQIKDKIKNIYNIDIDDFKIIKKSLDARKQNEIVYRYRILIEIYDYTAAERLLNNPDVTEYRTPDCQSPKHSYGNKKIHIIGTGPAGLFCALRLTEAGAAVHIFERGKPVDERFNDIEALEQKGILNTESNVLFGEGGAGTYSDGKLMTRISGPEIQWFYEKLAEHGAPDQIQYESKPHIGTDKIREIVKKIRQTILNSGGTISFNEKVNDIIIKNEKVAGVITLQGNEFPCDNLVLAAGHSARDTYRMLRDRGVAFQKKGFAVGVRVEHPSELINDIQYGRSKYKKILPTADYRLACNNTKTGRGIYSFCVCPGGIVINASSCEGMLNTNGMSYSKRDSAFSNSAIVVTVHGDDLESDVFSGIKFQEEIEKLAYLAGGAGFRAPAQRVTSFLNSVVDKNLPPVSFSRGAIPAEICSYL
ncbi:MAG: NAD(P)/FAD-dependent oxidoreductase, partial [Spirochaetes bacterium]|nr:NAD(P)/FAD-dependent oxidoreductase [Spirochaetota bacterium]